MGNNFIIGTGLGSDFWNFFSDFTYVAYIVLSFTVLALFMFLLTILYKKIRRKFPVKVNCWFCNNNTTVTFELSNCWDCPYCKQYNGFDKDGGYNKIIPEQYNHKLNESIFTTLKTSENSDSNLTTNGFCKLCNINQQLKIQQLALFVPLEENNYFEEIEQYRKKLEKAYKLCSSCEKVLQETLQKQEYDILTNRLNSHKYTTSCQKQSSVDKFGGWNILALIRKNIVSGVKVVYIIVGILLFLALVNHFETENQFINFTLPDFVIEDPFVPILKELQSYTEKIYSLKKELSFAGIVCWFLADFDRKVRKNQVGLVIWVLLHILLWTPLTGPQVLLSGMCLLLSVQATHGKFIHLYKNSLPRKLDFQSVKKLFPDRYNTSAENSVPASTVNSLPLKYDSFTSLNSDNDLLENKIKDPEQRFTGMSYCQGRKKMIRKRENEIESLLNEETEKRESKTPDLSPNSSLTNKNMSSFMDADKNCAEANGPFRDVYNTLNSLHIGGKKRKSNKPPNFLFSNHNFSEVKNSSSIIKPARLIKNLSSTSWADSNECNSRSSTPSSGYSSQKPEKPETNRYDFTKTMNPLSLNSFSRHSPNNYFDHYDNNHMFYNNMNCLSPSFVPFQQYPGPMGHTTIYTCTRPTNFPFTCSPCQGFSGQKFSHGSSHFSDTSECYNLFQESSKSFERNKRWCKLKSILYYVSIFLNITTAMSLFFFISTGVVLVDWKLPKFNFFV